MEHTLTSKANPRFKHLKGLLAASGSRRTHTLLLGTKLIEAWEAVSRSPGGSRIRPLQWLRLEGVGEQVLERRRPLETLILGEALMRELAEAGSPPELVLLAELGPEPGGPLAERVVGAWGIQDPGNLGAILRSAAAFGFQEALLGPGTADPFSPKALRGSMGAAFLMPLRRQEALEPDEGAWFALDGGPGALPLAGTDLDGPIRLLVGNEGHGWRGVPLPEGVHRLAIPIRGVESLNAAVALGIVCYECARRNPA
nr:RNA methyltransferase [uncultured Holophaga sp.]